ncbi:MAG: hypothetical protein Q9220_002065 [cf. Caloplaca sp. 1 TL-2023]
MRSIRPEVKMRQHREVREAALSPPKEFKSSSNRPSTLNRAERRATAFGHRNNPPEGYKALPIRSKEIKHRFSGNQSDHRAAFSDRQHRHKSPDDLNGQALRTPRDEHRFYDAARRSNGGGNAERLSRTGLEERPQRKPAAPLAIPYTTPASEFLYGHAVVTSALRACRRRMYKLYLYNGDAADDRGQDRQVRKLALTANVEVTRTSNLQLMDKMSAGRPHNGYILEASPLPKLPILGFHPVPSPQSARPSFDAILDHQSSEDEHVNGRNTTIKYGAGRSRYPFFLLLDGIKDAGNIGSIIRSSHFLGVDGILICNRSSAPLNPIALKAAAGAGETLPLFATSQPDKFIDRCQQNGWKFYASASPSTSDFRKMEGRPFYSTSRLGNPLRSHPCIVMLGSEGDGLQGNIQRKADYLVGVEAQRDDGVLDSLNVSVASALLCDAFLRGSSKEGKVEHEVEDALATDMVSADIRGDGIDSGVVIKASEKRLF